MEEVVQCAFRDVEALKQEPSVLRRGEADRIASRTTVTGTDPGILMDTTPANVLRTQRQVDIWIFRVPELENARALVHDPAALRDADRFRSGRDAAAHLLKRAMTHRLVGRYLDEEPPALVRTCEFCAGAHGRPRLPGREPRLELSISRSGDLVAIGLAASRIGIDIQHVVAADRVDALAAAGMTAAERTALARSSPAAAEATFVDWWTAKEAVLKAIGVGLAHPPADLDGAAALAAGACEVTVRSASFDLAVRRLHVGVAGVGGCLATVETPRNVRILHGRTSDLV